MRKIIFIGVFSFWASAYGFAQSLYDDVNTLLQAVEHLENNKNKKDSLCARASSQVVAILSHYSKPLNGDSISIGSWDDIKKKYARNPLIKSIINDSLLYYPQATAVGDARLFGNKLNIGDRQKIVQKQFAKTALSPADYLSISKTMERYRTPVFPPMQALQLSAQNSNRNIQNGLLTSQAAIIEGLAKFILERAKDEVIINFLDRLVKEETPNFLALFPTVVNEFGKADYSYSDSFVDRLRQAFYEDVQRLSVRLPLLMLEDAYFEPLQADPVAYNLLALYSLVSLVQFDMPVEEAVPATSRYLYESFSEKTKDVNLILADTAHKSVEYQKLIAITDTMNKQLKVIYKALHDAEIKIGEDIEKVKKKYPDAAPAPYVGDYLAQSSYNLDVLFGENQEFGLNLLPQLLKGQLDSAYIIGYNTLGSYDKFFGTEREEKQWRAAGLEMLQKLNGTWYNDQTIADIFYSWQKDLIFYKEAADRWREDTDTEGVLLKAQKLFDADVMALINATRDERVFWEGKEITHDQKLALIVLENLLKPNVFDDIETKTDVDAIVDPNFKGNIDVVKLERKRVHFKAVEERLVTLDTLLYTRNAQKFRASPVRKYLNDKQITAPYVYIKSQILDLEDRLSEIQKQLATVESIYANTPCKTRDNAKPIMQVTDLASNLMYCLRSNDRNKKWLTQQQLDTVLDGGRREAAFLGLMQQRLNSNNKMGSLSSKGLSDLVQLTIKDIDLLNDLKLPDSLNVKDTLSFFRKASFAVHTLTRVLELPLIPDGNKINRFVSLKDHSEKLRQIPEISERVLDFIYYVNVKNHSKAIGSLIRIFTNLDIRTDTIQKDIKNLMVPNTVSKRKSAIRYLQKYGDFIAGLIDARTRREVDGLLQQIADPPGSSRIKRKSPLTVSLNAYFGGTVGWESWNGDALAKNETFLSPALTMPVGITLSGLFGQAKESFSAFISFLDVGAVLTYKPKSLASVESDFTFKNVFKPGIQLHWNIKKSPFYLGVGWQYGPQYISVNEKQKTVSANRYFLGFGVDVPIRTIYQR